MKYLFSIPVLLLFFSSPCLADIKDDFRACEQGYLRKLPRNTAPIGSTPAEQYCLGLGYWFQSPSNPLPINVNEAVKWYALASQAGHKDAQVALGYHYEKGRGVQQDFAKAAELYRKAADQGSAPALFNLGRLYDLGRGVPVDKAESERLIKLAEQQGSQEARVDLRRTHQRDTLDQFGKTEYAAGVDAYKKQDYKTAVLQFQNSAAQGNTSAQVALANLMRQGLGIQKNAAQAVEIYIKAAERGHSSAQAQLGLCYEHGDGISENWVEAAKWYKKSADQLNGIGLFSLGRAFQYGMGVTQNREKAVWLFEKAENQGEAEARFFSRWLKTKSNCLGYRNESEREKFAGICSDPERLFNSSKERTAWLADMMSKVKVDMFGAGNYASGACGAIGGDFRSGNCYGNGGAIVNPGSQDRYGNNLW